MEKLGGRSSRPTHIVSLPFPYTSVSKHSMYFKLDYHLVPNEKKSEEQFTHGYYQGLIIDIGNMKHYQTYVPAQDQNRKFLEKPLKDICTTIHIPDFSFENLTDRARTVGVIWFNERNMPNSIFEVEHSTDIQNSFAKFCDLQDFHSRFLIVAPKNRRGSLTK